MILVLYHTLPLHYFYRFCCANVRLKGAMGVLTATGEVAVNILGRVNFHVRLVATPTAWLYKTPTFSNNPDYALSGVEKAVYGLEAYACTRR